MEEKIPVEPLSDLVYDLLLSWDFYSEKGNYLEFFQKFYKILHEIRYECLRKSCLSIIDDILVVVFLILETLKDTRSDVNVYENLDKLYLRNTFSTQACSLAATITDKKDLNDTFREVANVLNILSDHFADKVIIFSNDSASV